MYNGPAKMLVLVCVLVMVKGRLGVLPLLAGAIHPQSTAAAVTTPVQA